MNLKKIFCLFGICAVPSILLAVETPESLKRAFNEEIDLGY